MAHFPNPLNVRALPELNAVRVSVRASESRVDEWTISASDVASVLTAPETAEWRGTGELRVQITPQGGSVAFHNYSGDRAIIRGPESMVNSFVAHLQAAYSALPPVDITVSRFQTVAARSAPVAVVQEVPSTSTSAMPGSDLSAQAAQLAALSTQSSSILEALAQLTTIVQKLTVAGGDAPTALPTVTRSSGVLQEPAITPTDAPVFIPSISTSVTGSGLTADEKSGAADDLAAAAAALRAAKQNIL